LKYKKPPLLDISKKSQPSGAEWIEIPLPKQGHYTTYGLSLPGLSGLKLKETGCKNRYIASQPSGAEWIEIHIFYEFSDYTIVSAFRG